MLQQAHTLATHLHHTASRECSHVILTHGVGDCYMQLDDLQPCCKIIVGYSEDSGSNALT